MATQDLTENVKPPQDFGQELVEPVVVTSDRAIDITKKNLDKLSKITNMNFL